ncbi:MAG: hypothetical protein M5U12_26615 [Verrucomicrobia bacterium]|nr:hypothetical protein [Verrucomicrobiota bacterium]
MRALAPEVAAYVDFILGTPGLLRHQFLRRLWARHQRWGSALFRRTVERAHRYHITSLETLERIARLLLDDPALPGAPGRSRAGKTPRLSGGLPHRHARPLAL